MICACSKLFRCFTAGLSGLTGACINAASFNTFIRRAMDGISFVQRFREFSKETNWSNGEVVQRGTGGGNYGEDGFMRPGKVNVVLLCSTDCRGFWQVG